MAKNLMSESGIAEDMIRSYIQFGCAEIHAKTLYEKTIAELNNGLVDVEDAEVVQKHLDKAQMFREDINDYAELRRGIMRKLLEMFPNGDKSMWCQAKHLGIGMMTLFESYQASDDDAELLNMAYKANEAFTKVMSRFLGVEITSCIACLSDMLRGDEYEETETN